MRKVVIFMYGEQRPEIPLGLGYALSENSSALKYFAELSSDKQREIIDRTNRMSSRSEIRSFVRNMTGMSNIL